MYRILTLSPGSTSTKCAVFEDDKMVFKTNVEHDGKVLATFATVNDQLDYRKETILEQLRQNGFSISDMDAFSAYSGGLEPMEGGIYPVNDKILDDARNGRSVRHPAVLGSQLVHAFSVETGKPAFLVNPPDVDEFQDLARVTGIPGVYRECRVHVLNQKEVGMRYAKEIGKPYEECNLVVAHVGGGLSVTAQKHGRIVDSNDVLNGDGPMAPNRSGSVPAVPIIKMCYSQKYTQQEMVDMISKKGGLLGHLGTDSALEIKDRIARGDKYAKLIYDAMAYQLAKFIGSYAVVLGGKVDGILLTGGISKDPYFVEEVRSQVEWIAPVKSFGGDFEMEALASGAIRALSGQEATKEYTGVPVWSGFNF